MVWLGVAAAAVALTLAIDAPLLAWFAGHRGWWFAVRAMPLRVLYYGLNAASVSLALLGFGFRRQQPHATKNDQVTGPADPRLVG